MIILFLHGWTSVPGGRKPTYLKDHGHEVINPALDDDEFDAAVRIAQAEYDQHQPDVVVGSSRGGAVAMNINSGHTPLLLLCPAWRTWGMATTVKPNTVILHSPADETVPFADSQELLRNSGLPESALIEVGTEHRLADEESLKAMLNACEGEDTKVRKSARHKAAVRRRFGIHTLLIITAMYGVLFGGLRALGSSGGDSLLFALFFTTVGLGQVFLFKGKHPLRASAIVGAILFPCIMCGIIYYQSHGGTQGYLRYPLVVTCLLLSIVGTTIGCVGGLFIAGVFLLINRVRCWRATSKARHHVEETKA